jgi:dTDP-4-dehydrorhamnose 3,5-epimerase
VTARETASPGQKTARSGIAVTKQPAGAVLDVVVDLRRESPTYLASLSIELSATNRTALYIPAGLAHGFQTLQDDSELLYMIDVPYEPSAARGVRWNDPAFTISWPEPVTVTSPRDLVFPDWPR